MKNKMFTIMGVLLCLFMFNDNVKAACLGNSVQLDDEYLFLNCACGVGGECTFESQSNSNGTAYTKELENGYEILVLENYNGGSISHTGSITVELIGENYITAKDGYGILSRYDNRAGANANKTGEITFVGDGTLTIKSKVSFAKLNLANSVNGQFNIDMSNQPVSTVKINIIDGTETISVIDVEESSKEEDNEEEPKTEIKEEDNEEKNNLIFISLIISLSALVLCLIIVIVLALKNNKLKKLNS